jgi:uncharacterized membrane protein
MGWWALDAIITLVMKRIFAIFLQGLVAILPLAVTLVLILWLGSAAERTLGAGIKRLLPEAWYVTGMGVGAGLLVIFAVGLLVNVWGVPRLVRLLERQVDRIPLIKTVYGAVRDLLGFFGKPGGLGAVNKVVIVSFGASGIRAVGLLTRDRFDDLPAGLGGEGVVAVYLPYSYQVGGVTLIVPREHVRPIDMSLEDAMRFIVTAGVKNLPSISTSGTDHSRAP